MPSHTKAERAKRKAGKMVVIGPQKPGQKPLRFRKGGLHETTGTPMGEKIPASKVAAAAAGRFGAEGKKQAQFARNVLAKGRRTAARGRQKTVKAQFGFDGVVSRPTRFLAGERNRPERVQITPGLSLGSVLGGPLGAMPTPRVPAVAGGRARGITRRLREGAGVRPTPVSALGPVPGGPILGGVGGNIIRSLREGAGVEPTPTPFIPPPGLGGGLVGGLAGRITRELREGAGLTSTPRPQRTGGREDGGFREPPVLEGIRGRFRRSREP